MKRSIVPAVPVTGLPPGSDAVLDRIRARTGTAIDVRPTPAAFSTGPQDLEITLAGEVIGGFEFWWDEAMGAENALAALRDALAVTLDELFPDGWW